MTEASETRENTSRTPDPVHPMIMQRYKYVLSQKQSLNEKSFKVLGLYQTLCVALGAGSYVAYSAGEAGELSASAARLFLYLIFAVFEFVSLFAILSLLSGVVAWVSYKQDELDLEVSNGLPKRPGVHLGDFWRWYESYFIALIGIGAVGGLIAIQCLS
jgi:hypothetical protein